MSSALPDSEITLTPAEYASPTWPEEREFENDWRFYIGQDLIDIWDTFSLQQKKLIAENAQRIVDDEDYEDDED